MLTAALVLLLPLPIPFTNSFPAWAILLLAAGLLERDGLFILGGYVVFAAGVFYFIFLGEATAALLHELVQWLEVRSGGPGPCGPGGISHASGPQGRGPLHHMDSPIFPNCAAASICRKATSVSASGNTRSTTGASRCISTNCCMP